MKSPNFVYVIRYDDRDHKIGLLTQEGEARMSDAPMTTRLYRPADGNPLYPGATRADWVAGWAKMPGWDEGAAERAFDRLIDTGAMVEVTHA